MTDTPTSIVQYFSSALMLAEERKFSTEERVILDDINQKVATSPHLGDIVNFLFYATQDLVPCDRIGLAFLDEDGNRLVAHIVKTMYEPVHLKKGYVGEIQHGSLSRIIEQGIPRIIYDLEAYLERNPKSHSSRLLVKEGVRSSFTCPLMVNGRIIGLMFRSRREPNAFNDRHVFLHRAIVERLSQAVEKAYLIDRLLTANQAYSEMLGFVSHELKGPLGAMVMNSEALQKGLTGELNPKQKEVVERIIRKANYLLGLIDEYLNLARLESGPLNPVFKKNTEFLEEVVEPALDTVQSAIEEKEMKLQCEFPDKPFLTECDPAMMKIVMNNLLSNAVKYGYKKGKLRITVERRTDKIRVSVWNEGPGFPESQKLLLFRKFSRLQIPELVKKKGTGVGLYTCWRIVAYHRGLIEAHSEYKHWAEFLFEIPQPISLPQSEGR